jgi:serine/threonine protein kinase|mmetsp:Transcript_90128/g.140773  ORF Transcript_90128/g.140773 Transcript_90128/m.140773 type:complete len:421 (-) Transcript_90128:135-1397(-)
MGCGSSHTVHSQIITHDSSKCIYDSWDLQDELVNGNFIKVHKATEKGSGRQAVVKIYGMCEASDDISLQRMNAMTHKAGVHEARIRSLIGQHQNVGALYEIFRGHKKYFVVMEACECHVLSHLAAMPGVNEGDLARVFGQMLSGLAHIHSKAIAHRNISAESFRLGLDGSKLCDFSCAAVVPDSGCLHGSFGVAPYMSPEMINDDIHGTKTDIWSLGVVCYLMLYGKFPYMSPDRTIEATTQSIASGVPPPSFRACRPSCETTFMAKIFVTALLNRNVAERVSAKQALNDGFLKLKMYNTCDLQPILQAGELLRLEFDDKVVEQITSSVEDDNEYDSEIPSSDYPELSQDSLAYRIFRTNTSMHAKIHDASSEACASTCADSVEFASGSCQTSSRQSVKTVNEILQDLDCGLDVDYGLEF